MPEPDRGPSGHRRYDQETVRFLRAIKEAQAVGFTLAEIEEYLRVRRAVRASPSETLRVRMAAKIDEIDLRIAGLRRMRDELARVVGCACDSLDRCTCGAAYLARRGQERERSVRRFCTSRTARALGNTLRQTALGGAVLPWQDDSPRGARCRPVPRRGACFGPAAAFLVGVRLGEPARDPHLARATRPPASTRLCVTGLPVVLWFEHDLYDQLQLLDGTRRCARDRRCRRS